MRNDVINYLTTNFYSLGGFPVELVACMPWSQYLTEKGKDGPYGYEIIPSAAANTFNVEIMVISTLEQEELVRFQPNYLVTLAHIMLRLFVKVQGFCYIASGRNDEVDSTDEISFHQHKVSADDDCENEKKNKIGHIN